MRRAVKTAAVVAGCAVLGGALAWSFGLAFLVAAFDCDVLDPFNITPYDEDLEAPF